MMIGCVRCHAIYHASDVAELDCPQCGVALTAQEREALQAELQQQQATERVMQRAAMRPTAAVLFTEQPEPEEQTPDEVWRDDFRAALQGILAGGAHPSAVDANISRAANYADKARKLYDARLKGKTGL